MEEITLTGQSISAFREFLVENEKARATVEKYVQEAEQLRLALCGAPVTKAGVLAYRERLQQQYRALTVNNKLSAVNAYLRFCGAEHCEVKLLKVQRRAFREEQRDLTESEYRPVALHCQGAQEPAAVPRDADDLRHRYPGERTALHHDGGPACWPDGDPAEGKVPDRPAAAGTGGTPAAVCQGAGYPGGAPVPHPHGRPLDRSNIWHEMKTLCREAGVMPEKVFPHNLRHLFAKCFYEQEKDLAHLADLLGHSSIETTRIYVAVSARAHEQILEKMRLIV